jgi:hypothetical protein
LRRRKSSCAGTKVFYLVSHKILSVTLASGVIVLVVIKHLGLLWPLYALLALPSENEPGEACLWPPSSR